MPSRPSEDYSSRNAGLPLVIGMDVDDDFVMQSERVLGYEYGRRD